MNTFKNIALITVCLGFANTYAKNNCDLDNFLTSYSVKKSYDRMVQIAETSEANPLETDGKIEEDLRSRYFSFYEQAVGHNEVADLLQQLPEKDLLPIYDILSKLGIDYKEGREKINLNINMENMNTREAQHKALEKELTEAARASFDKVVDVVESLSTDQKNHLKDWAFDFIIREPMYQWGASADTLLNYLSDLKYSFFKQSAGRMTYGPYYLEYSFAQTEPALNLNAVLRPTKGNNEKNLKDLNLTITFSVFTQAKQKVSVNVCDFSLNEDPNFCKMMSFNKWCELQ